MTLRYEIARKLREVADRLHPPGPPLTEKTKEVESAAISLEQTTKAVIESLDDIKREAALKGQLPIEVLMSRIRGDSRLGNHK